ncbi:FimV/HubP family polar landmark protein [Pseudomonas sp. M30-35]|uniref:FimV/HubP family polar landmark protein n=1 Tax=Pseudomonas sp. M30-35 TaxID=1981174 RepID=UPI000B3D3767|nr:FimV/HubP family polar landmark protein [Pseudomonas sp. M30-35]ARU89111.1 peptigoglycan-binding protein LysM [Pseudomonas sp. M30-35]
MLRVRKLVLAMAAASALSSGMAHALGLGEVTLKSSLNQPLEAEIELVEVRDLAPNEVLPSLASPEDFNKAGVDRQFFLNDLKFTPVIKPNGKSVIRITSSKSVREPYLNFLVEVLWPNGRLLREYTVLLDPPLYSPQAAAAPRAAVTAPIARTTVAPTPRPAPRPAAPALRPASTGAAPASSPGATGSNEYRIQKDDSLWEIAQRSRQNGSIHQAMLAIQDLNPDAFIDGNINRMKSGQVLRLPDQAAINSRSQAEALAQVNQQNAEWREGPAAPAGARQLDATKREVAGAAPAKAEEGDKLKLVSAEAGKSTAGSDKGQADSETLSNKLAVTQESLDSTRRANEELSGRMNDLQSQVDKLQRLIKLKDDQLAKLQADLASQGDTAATAAVPGAQPEPAADTSAAAASDAEESASETPVAGTPAATDEPDFNYSEEPAVTPEAPAPVEAPTPAPAPEPVVAPEPEVAKPAAPAAQPAPAPASMVDDLLANPMLLGIVAAGGLLALLVILMIISRRKALKESESADDSLEPDNSFAAESELPDDGFAGLDDDFDLDNDQAEVAKDQPTTPQTADVLGEADIYIAYGRFNQAAELLQNAINNEPERSDLHLKLMEVYAEMGDRDGYARQQDELREMGGATEEVAQLNAKYPALAGLAGGLAVAGAADNDLDSFSLDDLTMDDVDATAAPVNSSPAATDSDDSFDLSLDDLESELDSQLQSTASAGMDSFDLDDELGKAASAPVADQEDDLGFELSLDDEADKGAGLTDELADFNFDLDSTQPSTTLADSDDDFLLDLDDADLSSTPVPAADAAPKAGSDDGFDLSEDFDLSLNDDADIAPETKPDNFAAQLDEVTAELDQLSESLEQQKPADELDMPEFTEESSVAAFEDEDDFDFLSGTDETATKLDLARAYIDMGDSEGARDILDEVVAEGNDDQQKEAKELINKLV